jgi:hypothetical protein
MMLHRVPGKRTAVSVSAIADCPFSIAQEYATEYLKPPKVGSKQAKLYVQAPFGPGALRHEVTLSAHLYTDSAEPGRMHDEIRLFWDSGSRLFPNFRGTLRFRIDSDRTRVLLEGTYAAPPGLIGRLFDALAGKWIARASFRDLAKRIAAHLAARQAAWLSDIELQPGTFVSPAPPAAV